MLDITKIFEYHKYIIRVKPDTQVATGEDEIDELLEDTKGELSKQSDRSKEAIIKRIGAMEKNNRGLIKSQ